ncbi:hypothetical protein IT575_07970 [bacterium]|nr:hypothetical protein [bacterium]
MARSTRLEEMEAAGELEPLAHSPEEIDSLLRMAGRRLSDARLEQLSPESRIVNAYQCVLACAKAALRLNDYRVVNGPRQHFLTLETLPATLHAQPAELAYAQSLRRKRNRDEYEGSLDASDSEAEEAAGFAALLLDALKTKLGQSS